MKATHPFSNPFKQLQVALRFIKQSVIGIVMILALMATLILHLIGVTHVTTAGVSHAGVHAHPVTHATSQLADTNPPGGADPWPHP